MHQSKLFELLNTFSPGTMKRFVEFCEAEYFNKSAAVSGFVRFIAQYHPRLDHPDLSQQKVIKKNKEITGKTRLNYLMNRILQLAEQFILVEQCLENPDSHLTLLDEYYRTGLPKHYRSAHQRWYQHMDSMPERNADYYHRLYTMKVKEYRHRHSGDHVFNPFLQDMADHLDVYYLAEKLRTSMAMLNLQSMLNIEYRISHLDEILSRCRMDEYRAFPVIQLYHAAIRLMINWQDESAMTGLNELLKQHESVPGKDELTDLYKIMLNICTRRINHLNDPQARRHYLDINTRLIGKGLLLDEGLLNPWRYINLVNISLDMGETEHAREFAREYRKLLPADTAPDVYHYCMALYHHYCGEYSAAMAAIHSVNFADVYLNIASRSMMIKLYYDAGEDDLLQSVLESTRIFLLRNKLIDLARKQQMQKFVDFTSRLYRYPSFEHKKLQQLLDSLPLPSGIAHHAWLHTRIRSKAGITH